MNDDCIFDNKNEIQQIVKIIINGFNLISFIFI